MTINATLARAITRWPAGLKQTIESLASGTDPMATHRRLVHQSTRRRLINQIGDYHFLNSADLSPDTPFWASATAAPCLVLASHHKDSQGRITTAQVEHFSFMFSLQSIEQFLARTETPPIETVVWAAGMAQAIDPKELKEVTGHLNDALRSFGLPTRVVRLNGERSSIIDERNNQCISDIGLGITKQQNTARLVSFGTTTEQAVLVSSAFDLRTNKPWFTSFITSEGVTELTQSEIP